MQQKNFLSFIFPFLAFLVFSVLSCWLTAESIFLSMGSIPFVVILIIALAIYALTAWGTRLIIDSLNMNEIVEHRRLRLIGGTLIVLFFWLAVSFPTNIHCLLFNRAADSVVKKEITWLEKGLNTILSDEPDGALIVKLGCNASEKISEIDNLKQRLVYEISHPEREGFGTRANLILTEIETAMKMKPNTIHRMKYTNNRKQLNAIINYYTEQIDESKDRYLVHEVGDFLAKIPNHEQNKKTTLTLIERLNAIKTALNTEKTNKKQVLKSAKKEIDDAYNMIDLYTFFGNKTSREEYYIEEKGMSLDRFTNVGEVIYEDFLHGKLSKKYDIPGMKSLIYLIFISLIIDIAAFLFFNIAFRKTNI